MASKDEARYAFLMGWGTLAALEVEQWASEIAGDAQGQGPHIGNLNVTDMQPLMVAVTPTWQNR